MRDWQARRVAPSRVHLVGVRKPHEDVRRRSAGGGHQRRPVCRPRGYGYDLFRRWRRQERLLPGGRSPHLRAAPCPTNRSAPTPSGRLRSPTTNLLFRWRAAPPATASVLNGPRRRARSAAALPYVYPGIPITGADPPSTILAPGTTSLLLTVQTPAADSCRYSIGGAAFEQMKPFASGEGTAAHQTTVNGLNPDPTVVNHVFVRCAAHSDYALELLYRARSSGNAPVPAQG